MMKAFSFKEQINGATQTKQKQEEARFSLFGNLGFTEQISQSQH
jgi:hypothetical protein